MARRLVTVGDDLVLHSSVTVPLAQVTGAGTAAAAATGDFATAAQGALADTATQPGDLGDSAGLDVGTTTGTVAAGDDSRITGALAAANLDTAATALDANPASALRVQQDARLLSTFVAKGASICVPAPSWANVGGSPTLSHVNNNPLWLLDAASIERLSAYTLIPAGWATFHLDLYWTNAGAGSGNVVWLMRTGVLTGDGDTVIAPSSGASVTATAGAQNVVVKTRVLTGATVGSTSKATLLYLIRNATDGADTLANDAALLWVEVVRAS